MTAPDEASVTAHAPPGGTATAVSSPPPLAIKAVTTTTVEHNDPSPMPEGGWLWRRLYVFVVTVALCTHIWLMTRLMTDVGSLREIARNDQLLIALYALLYLAGASAESIAKLVAAVRTSRRETTTSAPPPATITTSPGGDTTVSGADGGNDGELPEDQRVKL